METMNLYDNLLEAVHYEYDTIRFFKKSEQREISLVRHKSSGTLYVFKHFSGSSEVYRKLLAICCPNLPQIMEVGEKEGRTALLEEYVQGDNLGEILEGGLLTSREARQITRQLCSALWVLHSMGVVHRDVKPENIIIRGKEAVLIDFDASRTYKNNIREDTQILGIFMHWAFCLILCLPGSIHHESLLVAGWEGSYKNVQWSVRKKDTKIFFI